MSSRNLMAGEWIGEDGKLHGPFVCECHRAQPTRFLENARKVAGLIDDAGYALCARCKSRLENETKLYCRSCDELVYAEMLAGFPRS